MALVQRIIESKGIEASISNGWLESFRKRQPTLTLKSAMHLTYAHAMATNSDVFHCYYDMLDEMLKSNGIFDYPTHIFNCDETDLPLSPKSLKIVDLMGSKNSRYVTGRNNFQVTILAYSCVAGYVIPFFKIFIRKSLNQELTNGEIPRTLYSLSDSGWMTGKLFYASLPITLYYMHHRSGNYLYCLMGF